MADRDYNYDADVDEDDREYLPHGPFGEELYPEFDWLKGLAAACIAHRSNADITPSDIVPLILAARYLDEHSWPETDCPDWVHILAGGNPDEARAVIETVFELGELEG